MKVIALFIGNSCPNCEKDREYTIEVSGRDHIKVRKDGFLCIYNTIVDFLSDWDKIRKL